MVQGASGGKLESASYTGERCGGIIADEEGGGVYLRPTLVRDVELDQRGTAGIEGSSCRAVEEELRRQHYIAKNYHFLSKKPESHLGWMEVMQHHGVKTRILDWSESMIHSLIFALECFFNNKEYRVQDRLESSPCVWIFEPIKWNTIVLEEIVKNKKLLESCILSLPFRAGRRSEAGWICFRQIWKIIWR